MQGGPDDSLTVPKGVVAAGVDDVHRVQRTGQSTRRRGRRGGAGGAALGHQAIGAEAQGRAREGPQTSSIRRMQTSRRQDTLHETRRAFHCGLGVLMASWASRMPWTEQVV